MFRRELLAGGLVPLTAVLAGCPVDISSDGDQGTALVVEISNDHDQPYVITLGLAPPDHEGLALEFPDGAVETYPELDSFDEIPEEDLRRAVSIRPVGDDVQTRILRWETPQGATVRYADVALGSVLFFSVARPSGSRPMLTFGSMTCGSEATFEGMRLGIDTNGIISTTNDCGIT